MRSVFRSRFRELAKEKEGPIDEGLLDLVDPIALSQHAEVNLDLRSADERRAATRFCGLVGKI